MKPLVAVLTAALLLSCPLAVPAQSSAAERLAEARAAYQRGDTNGANKLLETAIEAAVQEQNREVEADARAIFGVSLKQRGQYDSAEKQFTTALALFEQLNNRSRMATVMSSLGDNLWSQGNVDESHRYFQQAMSIYTSLNDLASIGLLHYSLAFFPSDGVDHIQSGLKIAREISDRKLEAMLLHVWADHEYAADGFGPAFERLNQARSILEDLGDRADLARVLTSLGRLYRVHGYPDQALPFYKRARELQEQSDDRQGVIQSLNAIGVSLQKLGRNSEALVTFEEALRLAKETGSPLLIRFMLDGLASAHLNLGEYLKAADLLEQSRLMPTRADSTLALLAEARFGLGKYEAALQAAKEGLELGGMAVEQRRDLRLLEAQILWKLRRTSEALAEIHAVTESIEEARRTLIPTDFMKQGFSDTERNVATAAIDILLDGNEPRQALATAEQARNRALLDLLSAKGLSGDTVAKMPSLLTRGSTNDLPSPAAANPSSDADLVALAQRLDATILAYWVSEGSTTIWTVSPAGKVNAARVDSGENILSRWIDEALHQTPQASKPEPQNVQLASRSGDTVLTSRGNQAAWKRLYNALIRPVRANLPSKGRHHLLIIPSGPLFRLSFAALMDEKGRYLIEDYSLHYAPSAGVLSHTLKTKRETRNVERRYLFISNPSAMPPMDGGKRLPALPGSDDEVKRISRLFASNTVSTLRGTDANEKNVLNAIESATVIHLATHGIVNNSDPFASYLALGRDADGSSDGRLSANEVYRLNLHADLVVLSACRTGLGRISGDGVAGLARAFFYAGAASVVATLWDVADDPASQLVADFYQSMGTALENDKSEALRNAQLRLLRTLRRGEVRVDTPFGKLALPEDPVLWAGFILLGEP